MRKSSLCAASLTLLVALAAGSGSARADANGGGGASPGTCPVVTQGYSGATGTLVTIGAGASIVCPEPGGFGNVPHNPAVDNQGTPADGTPCTAVDYQPLSFIDGPPAAAGSWKDPWGGSHTDPSQWGDAPSPGQAWNTFTTTDAGTNDYWAAYTRPGTWHQGQCQPNPNVFNLPRIVRGAHTITPATSPIPDLAPYIARAEQNLQQSVGQVGTLPPAFQGMVNIPQCFSIDNVPPEVDQEAVLPGPPDGSGRQIRYVLVIRAARTSVDWDFGNGEPSTTVPAPTECGTHDVLVAHNYVRIGDYTVVGHEHWTVAADLFWFDSNGANDLPIDVGQQPPALPTPPIAVHIGQLEGVPVG